MDANERVEHLWKCTKELGLDFPSDTMLYDMICDVEFNTLCNPEMVARTHDLKWKKGSLVNDDSILTKTNRKCHEKNKQKSKNKKD